MQAELVALLAVQEDDAAIRALEAERDALAPRVAALDRARSRAEHEVTRAEEALAKATTNYHALSERLADHKARHEKNVAVLEQARRMREATAAMQQVEMARRVLAEEETELADMARRIGEMQSALQAHREALATLESEQAEERAAVAADEARIAEAVGAARRERDARAAAVSRSLLSRYERIAARRRDDAVYPLRGLTCSACDTTIPLQRRNALIAGGAIDVCEGCGVLLYAAPEESEGGEGAGTPADAGQVAGEG